LRSLLRSSTVREPAFSNLMVLYRKKSLQQVDGYEPTRRRNDQNIVEGTSQAAIRLRSYKNTLIASIKMVIPEKELLIRPLDLLKLDLITLSGALYLAYLYISTGRLDLLATLPPLIVFLARTFLIYSNTSQRYQNEVSQQLLDAIDASDSSACLQVVDSAEAQFFKEISLAFFFAYFLDRSGGVGSQEAAAFAGYLLEEEFGYQVSVDLSDAFAKLREIGLIKLQGPDYALCLALADLKEACALLQDRCEVAVAGRFRN